jgi:hypothetical protein
VRQIHHQYFQPYTANVDQGVALTSTIGLSVAVNQKRQWQDSPALLVAVQRSIPPCTNGAEGTLCQSA